MNKNTIRSVLIYLAIISIFVLLDLTVDWLAVGYVLTWVHVIPALAAVVVSTLLLHRMVVVRRQNEEKLKAAYDEMELRVADRTAELAQANQTLQARILEREQAEQERQKLLGEAEVARRRAEDLANELQTANHMLNALIETLPAGMVIVDADGEVVLANPKVQDIMGSELGDGVSFQSESPRLCRMDGTPIAAEDLPLNQAVRSGVITTGDEVCLCREDGTRTTLWIAASPVRDDLGRITSAVEIVQDITNLKQMAQAVHESEETARALMDALSESAFLIDTHLTVLAVNEIAAKRLGTHASQMVGRPISDFMPREIIDSYGAFIKQVLQTGQPVHFEVERDGLSFEISVHPVFDTDGSVLRLALFGRDVTEHKQAEQTLRASEEKFATVFQYSPDVIAIGRLSDGVMLDINESFTKLMGYSREEVVGRIWSDLDLVPPSAEFDQVLSVFEEKGYIGDQELHFIASDRTTAIMLVSLITITIGGEPCFLVIAHDITTRKLSEEALRKVQAELALDIQKRTAMEERQRLARELHDSVSQALYGISLGAHTALALFDSDRGRVLEALNYVLALAQGGLTEMRALIFELRPESLELEGLAVALSKQSAALSARHGIKVELDLCAEPDVSLPIKEAIYRIAQEALQNAVKHARPAQLDVRLICEPGCLQLEVCDNGIGFDPMAAFPGHLGLRSMRERAARVGGTLEVRSAPGCGTQILASIPLEN